jgi:hypothetical protein
MSNIIICDKCKKRINKDKHNYIFTSEWHINRLTFHGDEHFCSLDCFTKYFNDEIKKHPK